MSLKKYKWKLRILLLETPDYDNEKYQVAKNKFKNNIQEFHKRYIKLITKKKKGLKFNIKLIGFDGQTMKEYKKLDPEKILQEVDKVPLEELKKKFKKLKPINLSLYSNYNPNTAMEGLGYKDKEKAIYTINKIKKEPINYQVNVVNTMLGRAKNHPNRTKGMNDAIKVFEKWMKDYKNKV